MQIYARIAKYTQEKEIIAKHHNSFGLTLPANLLAYYNKSLAEFIRKNPRPFFIDPVTYIFVTPLNMLKRKDGDFEEDQFGDYKLKKSYQKLVSLYDKKLMKLFKSGNPLRVSYFKDPKNFDTFVKNNIDYQKNLLSASSKKVSRYDDMAGESGGSDSPLEPEFITAPYFYFRDTSDPWYTVNLDLLKRTKELCPNDSVYSVICTDKQNLGSTFAAEIASDFDAADGFLLFASNFDEYNESYILLKRLLSFVNRLSNESSKPIINLYGNFFSVFLNYYGLTGSSSGLCLLDHKDALQEVTGGMARIKYYLPSARGYLTESDFRTFLHRFCPRNECNCSLCRNLTSKKDTLPNTHYIRDIDILFTSGSRGGLMAATMEHFISCRLNEAQMVESKSLSEVKAILTQNRKTSQSYGNVIRISNFVDRVLKL